VKRLFPFFLALVLIVVSLCGCGGNSTEYVIATDATWPPFEYVDDNNAIVGFDIDLMNAIAEAANIKITFQNVAWEALLAGMAQGTYDASISSITIKPERAEQMLFSDPYYIAGQMIVVEKDNDSITGADSLVGKRLGAQQGTTGDGLANEVEGATVKSYSQIGLAIQDLLNGQVDAVICDTPIADGYVQKNGNALKIVGDALTTENYGIAVSKGNEELLEKINEGLAAVKADATYDELIQKWLAT
jgi:polar amino acid transport system substrate-binding protein